VPAALDLAREHYAERQDIAGEVVDAGLGMWQQVQPADLTASWSRFVARLAVVLRGGQLAAAASADEFADGVLEEQGARPRRAGRTRAGAFSGIASNGRDLDSLLLNPVIAAKVAIRKGNSLDRALGSGRASLAMVLRTQVADAGRVADGVAIAARPRTTWTRMAVGDSCPRCILLAGRVYRYSEGFLRHPLCDCVHIPTAEDTGDDFTTDPRQAFDEGRVVGLSKADEQAIRDGADLAQIVNAHRGMTVAGVTTEGTTRRGFAGRRLAGRARLMPERIYRESDSREQAIELLRQHGYIV
jgi:hypothetical protein